MRIHQPEASKRDHFLPKERSLLDNIAIYIFKLHLFLYESNKISKAIPVSIQCTNIEKIFASDNEMVWGETRDFQNAVPN